ncbi:MAG: sterol carrier protein domain-containing protein [Proteobacteria bacterium]|nr:sterol carrier protein domain-containing protein [Pseudomonadota bacterium]
MHSFYRPLHLTDDLDAMLRIWCEVGWISGEDHEKRAVAEFLEGTEGICAQLGDSVEAVGTRRSGSYRYETQDLPLSVVASITVSRVARGRRFGGGLTARLVADAAMDGAALSILGMFDQGFYDKMGFGTGAQEHFVTIDPAQLKVPVPKRVPVRLGADDVERMHACRLRRMRVHGTPNFAGVGTTRCEVSWEPKSFGLGFEDESGTLTHHLWCTAKGEHGPYRMQWMVYQTREQALELLGLVASWGDQVHGVRMVQSSAIRLQDLVRRPFKHRAMTAKGTYQAKSEFMPWWQARIVDLQACIAAAHVEGGPLRFNLTLSDPIAAHLPDDAQWKGLSGDWTVELGKGVQAGHTAELPTLTASVGAFSRLFLGVASATALSWTDDLDGPKALLDTLDRRWRVPTPHLDWDL